MSFLPRLDSALIVSETVDDRLREAFETLHTHRVMEVARAIRDGESLAHMQGPDPLQRNRATRTRPEGAAPGRREFTRIEALDDEIEALEAKERKMKTSGKSYSVVIDRRTHKSLMLAKTVTRLPKLDCSKALRQGPALGLEYGGAMSQSGPEETRRRSENEAAQRGCHGRRADGAQTDRSRRREPSRATNVVVAGKVAAAKASEEVTQWKRRPRKGSKKTSKMESNDLNKASLLPPMRATWKVRVKETQASHEVTEWRGLKRFEQLQRSWLHSEDEFRALLASFEVSHRGRADCPDKAHPHSAEEGEGSSFFLTAEPALQPLPSPRPHSRQGQTGGKGQGHESDQASSEGEENCLNPSQIVARQISVVAPSVGSCSSDEEDGDDGSSFLDAGALRQRYGKAIAEDHAKPFGAKEAVNAIEDEQDDDESWRGGGDIRLVVPVDDDQLASAGTEAARAAVHEHLGRERAACEGTVGQTACCPPRCERGDPMEDLDRISGSPLPQSPDRDDEMVTNADGPPPAATQQDAPQGGSDGSLMPRDAPDVPVAGGGQ